MEKGINKAVILIGGLIVLLGLFSPIILAINSNYEEGTLPISVNAIDLLTRNHDEVLQYPQLSFFGFPANIPPTAYMNRFVELHFTILSWIGVGITTTALLLALVKLKNRYLRVAVALSSIGIIITSGSLILQVQNFSGNYIDVATQHLENVNQYLNRYRQSDTRQSDSLMNPDFLEPFLIKTYNLSIIKTTRLSVGFAPNLTIAGGVLILGITILDASLVTQWRIKRLKKKLKSLTKGHQSSTPRIEK